MGISFQIQYLNNSEVTTTLTYSALASTVGRKAIDITIAAPEVQDIRFHPPGIDGNYLIRAGRTGGLITCDMLYIGDLQSGSANNLNTILLADQEYFSDRSVSIIYSGITYTNCNLLSMQKQEPIKATGLTSTYPLVMVKVRAVFQRD